MNQHLYTINTETISPKALDELEAGKIIYLPNKTLSLEQHEQAFLSAKILDLKRKNISYDFLTRRITGCIKEQELAIASFMQRFAEYSKSLVDNILPNYKHSLKWGRTSYRPAEVLGRKTSARKDDTRLHVDAFVATPVNGMRILRVFCNLNPEDKPRVWQVGEPFIDVVNKFAKTIPPYRKSIAYFLKWIKATKTLRSKYDHQMLHLHDQMKLDNAYQASVKKQQIDFPAHSTWIVFTDHVSHAALSGQFLLEQTFYLPVEAMQDPNLSPLKRLNSYDQGKIL